MRVAFGLLLSLCLAATSLSMAVARGQARVGGVVVLCTGTGPLAVAVDADGRPMGPRHICPDCALSLFSGLAESPGAALAPLGFRVLSLVPISLAPAPPAARARPFARGPPAFV